mmetsp:Transcript_22437/g.49710  ORF Transcript_22437/g.49710 Transcript_22437/m.49710 type:complete len:171 (+) Transcript_22437:38-550(+)
MANTHVAEYISSLLREHGAVSVESGAVDLLNGAAFQEVVGLLTRASKLSDVAGRGQKVSAEDIRLAVELRHGQPPCPAELKRSRDTLNSRPLPQTQEDGMLQLPEAGRLLSGREEVENPRDPWEVLRVNVEVDAVLGRQAIAQPETRPEEGAEQPSDGVEEDLLADLMGG